MLAVILLMIFLENADDKDDTYTTIPKCINKLKKFEEFEKLYGKQVKEETEKETEEEMEEEEMEEEEMEEQEEYENDLSMLTSVTR